MLRSTGFTFMFAPRYHPAMKNVAAVRRELGVKTIFNILGPLTNPARAHAQIVGVSRVSLLELMGTALRALGVTRGAIVYAQSGIDEVAGDVPTSVYSFGEAGTRSWSIVPQEYGIDAPAGAIAGGSVERCREAFLSILAGEASPRSEVVALNAALALYVAGRQSSLRAALEQSRAILASGAALRTYERAKALGA
jgi:anthranilate phosphoribosyltransferase